MRLTELAKELSITKQQIVEKLKSFHIKAKDELSDSVVAILKTEFKKPGVKPAAKAEEKPPEKIKGKVIEKPKEKPIAVKEKPTAKFKKPTVEKKVKCRENCTCQKASRKGITSRNLDAQGRVREELREGKFAKDYTWYPYLQILCVLKTLLLKLIF